MRLSRIKISNHSRLADVDIAVRDHLVLVGPNDVGKSSLLRCLDLVLGASTPQLYGRMSVSDFRATDAPLVIEVELKNFSETDKALFPDEIAVGSSPTDTSLTVRLVATADETQTLSIQRIAPAGGTSRQLSREQVAGLGWKFLSATAQARDLQDNRKSTLDEIMEAIDLGEERASFEAITKSFAERLGTSEVLGEVRGSLADQLSKALPDGVSRDDLAFIPGATADEDVLSGVRLQVSKRGTAYDLSEQSDGTRALYAIALYDLVSGGANVVGIDEPEIHLHPTSQRSLARLLKAGTNQKILATHSADIVGAFDPEAIVTVRKGGQLVQPQEGFLRDDERMSVHWWVRDRLEPLTCHRVVAVEGPSDRIILQRVAEVTGRNLDRLGISVLEASGSGNMSPIEKLFGPNGFDVPMSRLIDADAEEAVAADLGVNVADLPCHSIWVSRADLEDEYVSAIGVQPVLNVLRLSGQFSRSELQFLTPSGANGVYTADDVASFCRRKSTFKMKAAISVLPLLTNETASKVASIQNLLNEISS